MFRSKTVFAIGAGASFELGFPLGSGLKDRIGDLSNFYFDHASLTRGDELIHQALHISYKATGRDGNHAYRAGRAMKSALPLAISIDNYLEAHSADEHAQIVGKLAIVRAILEAEGGTKLTTNRGRSFIDFSDTTLQGSWLTRLIRNLTEGVKREDTDYLFQNVSFITFNYDRSLEEFLWRALQMYYGMTEQRAAELVGTHLVHHAYGSIGRLPWQSGDGPEAPYGEKVDARTLLELSKRIQTFSEQIDNAHHSAMIERLGEARTVVFLGFGFLEQNMQLLELQGLHTAERVYATALGFSRSDCDVITERIRDVLIDESVPVELRNDLTAARLFDEYSRSITQ
ncbi:SIR2 family protein [Luteibacter sp. Lutesp34]|uniref:SIR2 family protein n=1 Tax=Luteibacter sp. Lutesp34 TaxID=3243030 RepID=UPI0039B4AF2D